MFINGLLFSSEAKPVCLVGRLLNLKLIQSNGYCWLLNDKIKIVDWHRQHKHIIGLSGLLDILVFQRIGFDLDKNFFTKLLTKTFQCQSTDTKVLTAASYKQSGSALFFAGRITAYEVYKRGDKK